MSLSAIRQFFDYVWIASEVFIAIATRTRHSSGNVRDRGTLYLLWIVILTSVTLGSWFGGANGSNLSGGAPWLKPVSLAVLVLGLALRWTAVISLGKSYSSNVAIHATQTVMKTGLYGWMRHPAYTGLLLCIYSVGLHTRNWISLLIIAVPTTSALLYRIHIEEIALREHFGREYIDYSRVTRRLIPGIY